MIWETVILSTLVFLEIAALLTAGGRSELSWLAGPQAAIGVGYLLLLMILIYVQTISAAYEDASKISLGDFEIVSRILYAIVTVVGLVALFFIARLTWPGFPGNLLSIFDI